MKALGLHSLSLAEIAVGARLREIDEGYARLLAENIAAVGALRQPIEVRRRTVQGAVRHELIAGGHRLRAAALLGWATIPAFVFEASDAQARLAEIDENLIRHDLNPLDRAVFLAERKALYERLHPQTKAGVAGGRARQHAATDIMSFAADTAERCGLTARTIQRAVGIATRLTADSRRRIAGTDLAKKQSELLALSKLAPADQTRVLDLLLPGGGAARTGAAAGARTVAAAGARTVAAAHRRLTGAPAAAPGGQTLARLLHLWGRADRASRRQFLRHLHETGQVAGFPADRPPEEAAR